MADYKRIIDCLRMCAAKVSTCCGYTSDGDVSCYDKLMIDAANAIEELTAPHGTYQCFHCGSPHSVVWDSDFTYEDCGYEGDGIVHFCHCANCGAEIEYRIGIDTSDQDGRNCND